MNAYQNLVCLLGIQSVQASAACIYVTAFKHLNSHADIGECSMQKVALRLGFELSRGARSRFLPQALQIKGNWLGCLERERPENLGVLVSYFASQSVLAGSV